TRSRVTVCHCPRDCRPDATTMMAMRSDLGCLKETPAGSEVDQTYLRILGNNREPKTTYTDAALSMVLRFRSLAFVGSSQARQRHDNVKWSRAFSEIAVPSCTSLPCDRAAKY